MSSPRDSALLALTADGGTLPPLATSVSGSIALLLAALALVTSSSPLDDELSSPLAEAAAAAPEEFRADGVEGSDALWASLREAACRS